MSFFVQMSRVLAKGVRARFEVWGELVKRRKAARVWVARALAKVFKALRLVCARSVLCAVCMLCACPCACGVGVPVLPF